MWYLISTINRYVSRTFLFWFGIIFLTVALIISLFEMIDLTKRTMQHDVPFSILFQIAFLRLPKILDDLLPSITFFAALGCFLRLAQSQNFVVMFSFGVSRLQFLSGISFVVIALGVLNIAVLDPIRSALFGRFVILEEKVFQKKPYSVSFTDTGLWLRENFTDSQNIVHARNFNVSQKQFKNLTIFQFSKTGEFLRRVDAEVAELEGETWHMHKVNIISNHQQENLESYVEPTTITMEQIQQSTAPPETISFFQMPAFIEMLEGAGLNARSYAMLWHQQIAKIGMMISFVFLAACFCLVPTRNKSFSVIIGLSIIFAFLMHFFEHIIHAYGIANKIPLVAAAWIPPLITFISGYWLTVLFDDR
jgi:lipopolysaccharide export system permease protein